jgi:hypothetical protein
MTHTKIQTPTGIAYFHLSHAERIIENADRRAGAADGPVNHVRDEMTDKEWRDLYRSIVKAREALEVQP